MVPLTAEQIRISDCCFYKKIEHMRSIDFINKLVFEM